jgi:uncharacterized protein (TIGR04255 family)
VSKRREYPNPPITEGLVQFTFSERLPWNVATPGLLFEKLREQYPKDPDGQEQVQARFGINEPRKGEAGFSVTRGEQRFIYSDSSGTRLLVANAITASANSLKPYEGWPSLRERFVAGIHSLDEVAKIPGISTVHIRYINTIEIQGSHAVPVDTDDYFTIPVRTARSGAASFEGFIQRVKSVLENGTELVSTFATLENDEPYGFMFLLDLEVVRAVDKLDVESALAVANELKEIENDEFESSITDKARELFS